MNATTVQKWIRKNAPEYRLVRTQYIETLQAETTRADLAEELVRSLGRQIAELSPPPLPRDHMDVISGGPDSVIASDKVPEEGLG